MAFPREQARTAVDVGDLEIVIFKARPGGPTPSSVSFTVQVLMSNGDVVIRRGDLVTHLTPAQANQLQSFAQAMYDKAVAEIPAELLLP